MKRLGFVAVVAALAAPATASEKGWRNASDIGAYGLTAAAIGIPLIERDENGALQAAGSIGATLLLTEGLKKAFPKTRPDGSDRKSFPSGHTSRSFAAAATLYNRQGQEIGIPAFVVAGFVGLARVEGNKHFWSDVAAGAALGTVTGFLITRKPPGEKQAMIVPWVEQGGGGVSLSMRF